MDMDKYVMLKATIGYRDVITLGIIKDELNVDSNEALEMLNGLIQCGIVEPFAVDGTHFRVIKHNTLF